MAQRNPRAGSLPPVEGRVAGLQAQAMAMVEAPEPDPSVPVLAEVAAAGTAPGYVPPVSVLGRVTTARLLPARYSDSVLTRIAGSPEDLQAIFALDNATNERLHAQAGQGLQVRREELVTHGAYARIINAAFTHPHPLGARFSTPWRGAWYAGFELATAKAEVLFHRAVQLEEIAWAEPESLDYDHYAAEFTGGFHDLRQPGPDLRQPGPDPAPPADAQEQARAACLDPASYTRSQTLAVSLLGLGSQGVVYPSARRPGGTCLACFRPTGVHSVRKRELHRLTWYPDQPATFRRVPRG